MFRLRLVAASAVIFAFSLTTSLHAEDPKTTKSFFGFRKAKKIFPGIQTIFSKPEKSDSAELTEEEKKIVEQASRMATQAETAPKEPGIPRPPATFAVRQRQLPWNRLVVAPPSVPTDPNKQLAVRTPRPPTNYLPNTPRVPPSTDPSTQKQQ